jgi:hypothetical protein
MLLIKWFGLKKFYIVPNFSWGHDKDLWFFEIKFIFLQISVYSRTIAEEIVSVVNKSV